MLPSQRRPDPRSQKAFTLLELMVVLMILVMLATIAAPQVTKHLSKAKTETAKIQVNALGAAVDALHLDIGRFPTQEEGLRTLVSAPDNVPAWDGPYIKKRESLVDPWGNPYQYRVPGQHGEYDLYSFGSDAKEAGEGSARDIGNW